MSYWTLRIGLVFFAIGLGMLLGLGDFLPVELWFNMRKWFGVDSSGTEHYRIVAIAYETNQVIEYLLICAGLALLGVSAYLHFRE
ncbi:MAG: hypothetical protein K2X55_18090 [Burkholderiaceae bacterium]|nr:hypothetical protein [Burkholderiaceae bacterium]